MKKPKTIYPLGAGLTLAFITICFFCTCLNNKKDAMNSTNHIIYDGEGNSFATLSNEEQSEIQDDSVINGSYRLAWKQESILTAEEDEHLYGAGIIYGFQHRERTDYWIIVMTGQIGAKSDAPSNELTLSRFQWKLSTGGGTIIDWFNAVPSVAEHDSFPMYFAEGLLEKDYFTVLYKETKLSAYALSSEYVCALETDCTLKAGEIHEIGAAVAISVGEEPINIDWCWSAHVGGI